MLTALLLCALLACAQALRWPPRPLANSELQLRVASIVKSALTRNDGLLKDMMSAACLSTAGDIVAQLMDRRSESSPGKLTTLNLTRTRKFALFGFFDGAFAHTWYFTLDRLVQGTSWRHLLVRIATDTAVYTPLWCLWFLAFFGALEKKKPKDILRVVQDDWAGMVKVSSSFFLPMGLLLYTLVPVNSRVAAAAAGTMVATTIVSLWRSSKRQR